MADSSCSGPIILPVREEQLPACVRLIRESFLTVAEELGFTPENAPRFTAFATTQERLAWQLASPDRRLFACWRKGKPVGYYSLHFQEDSLCELNNLCVAPVLRHMGLGRRLVEHAFDKARKGFCKKITLSLVEENLVLKKWYRALGFVPIGTKKFDFFPFTCGYMEKPL